MKKLVFATIFLLMFLKGFSQESHYVKSQSLNLRELPNTQSKILLKLNRYDNLKVINDSTFQNINWVKAEFEGTIGYVNLQYISKGKAVVSISEYRLGAICNDGTRSNATGRGACSHHGGVSYWLTKNNKSVTILDN